MTAPLFPHQALLASIIARCVARESHQTAFCRVGGTTEAYVSLFPECFLASPAKLANAMRDLEVACRKEQVYFSFGFSPDEISTESELCILLRK